MGGVANMNIISRTLTEILGWIDGIIGNYGISVIVFTLLVRFVLLPLDIKSKKSMKAMQRVQPQIDAINKKYAQDKERLNQKMSELYKQEHINPLSGCLPMLLQLPILFCMFTAMRVVANEKTVQMLMGMMQGEAPVFDSFLWIKNVFQPDTFWSTVIPAHGSDLATISAVSGSEILTLENLAAVREFLASDVYLTQWAPMFGADQLRYSAPLLMWTIQIPMQLNGLYILPVLSCVTQVLSSKLMPQQQQNTAQNGQNQQSTQKMMQYIFPIFSLWICSTSTAAFTIYWVMSNVIQIAQTLVLDRIIDRKYDSKNIKGV